MRGIAGFCDFNRNHLQDAGQWAGVLQRMRTAIAHRGHDQAGEYLRCSVGFARTRLSIRDLSGGIDSTVVTALASQQLEAAGSALNPFSFDFAHKDECFQSNVFQPTRDCPFVDRVLALHPLHHTHPECDEATLADLPEDPQAPIHRFPDQKKTRRFLSQPKDYRKPWFGQLMAGPQMLACFLQVNY